MYSVFLVEDEIVTREGIRSNIPWETSPCCLVGEAPDGEIALPSIREVKPDILITDIKMPFMDGLELARIIRRDQPWIKIIILSGHDEFEYAQSAISIGVEEYLLKPVSASEMLSSLEKVCRQIDKDRARLLSVENLKKQAAGSAGLSREKWLLDFVTGRESASRPLEQARALGIDLTSHGYLVLVVEIFAHSDTYNQLSLVKQVISSRIEERDDIHLLSQSREKQILLVKHVSEDVKDETVFTLAQGIKYETERASDCLVSIGIGSVAEDISGIPASYTDANRLVRHMAMVGEKKILSVGDEYLNAAHEGETKHFSTIRKAKQFIEGQFHQSGLSLNDVASHVNLSPNHFSTVFSQEAGSTFIEYLTTIRIEKAKKLLLTSPMRSGDITYEVGYNDPHYFSYIFKKQTGVSPREFRLREASPS